MHICANFGQTADLQNFVVLFKNIFLYCQQEACPQVRGSTKESKVSFLEKKGLTGAEIEEAFKRAPDSGAGDHSCALSLPAGTAYCPLVPPAKLRNIDLLKSGSSVALQPPLEGINRCRPAPRRASHMLWQNRGPSLLYSPTSWCSSSCNSTRRPFAGHRQVAYDSGAYVWFDVSLHGFGDSP